MCVDTVYLDFTKAFDKVAHCDLIQKLHARHIPNALVTWIASFLSNRSQSVVIDGIRSACRSVTSGVPQGSVLGPLLFVLYSDDIDKVITPQVKIRKYADDIKLYCSYANSEENVAHAAMQLSLENILRWSDDNGLPINLKKSCRMHFGSKNVSLPYQIGYTTLVERTCERDLGVYIDNRMKFDDHIRHVVMKARSVAGRILRCFSSRNPFVILPLFDTLVRPILEYATPAWNPSLAKHIKAIESVQRNVTKRLCGLQKFSYGDRIRALEVSSLRARRDYIDLVEMFKIIHSYSVCGHVAVPTRSAYATRGHAYRLEQCKCSLNSYRFSFFVRVVKAWNCLPRKVVDSKSLNQFKVNLRRHLHI